MPRHDARPGQLRDLDRAEFGLYPCVGRRIDAIDGLATASQVIGAVVGECIGHCVGTTERGEIPGLFPGLLIEPGARPLLRLREAEDGDPVRIAGIVSGPERRVMLTVLVTAESADPGAAFCTAAITERASGRKDRPIGLAPFGELRACGARVDLRIPNGARHRVPLPYVPYAASKRQTRRNRVRKLYGIDVPGQAWISVARKYAISIAWDVQYRPGARESRPLAPLSRRQHRFESGRGRQLSQLLSGLNGNQCSGSVPRTWIGGLRRGQNASRSEIGNRAAGDARLLGCRRRSSHRMVPRLRLPRRARSRGASSALRRRDDRDRMARASRQFTLQEPPRRHGRERNPAAVREKAPPLSGAAFACPFGN